MTQKDTSEDFPPLYFKRDYLLVREAIKDSSFDWHKIERKIRLKIIKRVNNTRPLPWEREYLITNIVIRN